MRLVETAASRNPLDNPKFRAWFGNSQIVNDDGTPLVVYHGTDRDFEAFGVEHAGSRTDYGFFGRGFYFINDAEWGSTYAEFEANKETSSPNVRVCFLRMERPYIYRNDLANDFGQAGAQAFTDRLRKCHRARRLQQWQANL